MSATTEQSEIRLRVLLASGARGPREIQKMLGISQPTLSRLISRMGGQVVTLGRARAVRYALPRQVRGTSGDFPVYRVDERGDVHRLGTLRALLGGQYWWDQAEKGRGGQLFDHLPWFIQDMRPDGFVGRAFAQRQSSELGLPQRLVDWNDEDVLIALSRRGEDCVGNLIFGEESLTRYFKATREPAPPIPLENRDLEYPRLAQAAMAGDPPGSSAGGEQPKFTALIEGKQLSHVLVKFSLPTSSPEGRRWADLLICEHLALDLIREAGFRAAQTRVLEAGGRVFLEVDRFDRMGRFGRLPLVSLGAVDDEFFGRRDHWIGAAGRLDEAGMISHADAETLRWLSVFGIFISNTDQHFGNVSLIMRDEGQFTLAPAYDMLPMFYRPSGSEIAARRYELPVPPPGASLHWEEARTWAERYWERAAEDKRISSEFRRVCAQNRRDLEKSAGGPRLIG